MGDQEREKAQYDELRMLQAEVARLQLELSELRNKIQPTSAPSGTRVLFASYAFFSPHRLFRVLLFLVALSYQRLAQIIRLDVGGYKFSTTPDTVSREPDSHLAKLIAGFKGDGELFIDRDGRLFHHILNFLRYACILSFSLSLSL
jgi:hypothetical protein